MASTTITDAVVFPQDEGTGVADGSESWDSAGYLGLIASHVGGSYKEGMGLSALDTTNETVDVAAGHCFISESGNQVQSNAASASTPDTTLPSGSDMVYLVVFPTSTTVDLDVDTDAALDVVVDPTNGDTVTVEHNTTPTNPSLQIGTADSTAAGNGTSEDNAGQASPGGNGGARRLVETVNAADSGDEFDIPANHTILELKHVEAGSDGALFTDLSEDGGSTYINSGYALGGHYGDAGGGTGAGGSNSDAVWNPMGNVDGTWDVSASDLTGTVTLTSALDSERTWVRFDYGYVNTGGNIVDLRASGYQASAVSTNLVRFRNLSFTGGEVSIYEVVE